MRRFVKLRTFAVLAIFVSCLVSAEADVCTKDSCPGGFSYPQELDWEESSASEIWSWLKSQSKKEAVTFCKENFPNEVRDINSA